MDYTEASVWIIRSWKLSPIYLEVAETFHANAEGSVQLASLVHMACHVADHLGFSVGAKDAEPDASGVTDRLGFEIASSINAVECEFGL